MNALKLLRLQARAQPPGGQREVLPQITSVRIEVRVLERHQPEVIEEAAVQEALEVLEATGKLEEKYLAEAKALEEKKAAEEKKYFTAPDSQPI